MICPTCKFPHANAIGCVSCGWKRGSEPAPVDAALHPEKLADLHPINSPRAAHVFGYAGKPQEHTLESVQQAVDEMSGLSLLGVPLFPATEVAAPGQTKHGIVTRVILAIAECKQAGAEPDHWEATAEFRDAWLASGTSITNSFVGSADNSPPSADKEFTAGNVPIRIINGTNGLAWLVAQDGRRFGGFDPNESDDATEAALKALDESALSMTDKIQ